MNTFITSDTHFGHANIIKLCNRPFTSVEEMDEAMIERWNAVVGPKDIIWHLGDFALGDPIYAKTIFNKLNGIKHLIIGNHDHHDTMRLPWVSASVRATLGVEVNGKVESIVLDHYPLLEWNGYYRDKLHFHGHQHNAVAKRAERRVDAGVDAHDFRPWPIEEIIALARRD